MLNSRVSSREKEIVKLQIDRDPEGIINITKYCPHNYPAIIKVFPFFNERVFPTTYWLTCPLLNKKIAVLEDKNWISKMEILLEERDDLKESLQKSYIKYAAQRFSMLDKDKINEVKNKSMDIYHTLKDSGVGGIKENKGLKCLHAQVADYLANGINPVGKIVFNNISWPKECNICKQFDSD